MKAVRLESVGAKLVNVDRPKPGPEDVLVQVLAAGVCHTDLHLLDEVKAGEREPLIPGHEIAGRIAEIGADVYTIRRGDLVGVHFEQPCGKCRHCRRKRTNLCQVGTALGFDAPGAYAQFVVAKQSTVLPLPPGLDVSLAATLGCAGTTAYEVIVPLGDAGEGDLVVVIGAGGVGLAAVQIAKVEGAKVLAVEPREEARKAALDAGADEAVPPKDAAEAVRALTNNGADVVADFVGSKKTFEMGRSLLGIGGRFIAVAPGSETIEVSADDLVAGGNAYLGAHSSTMADFARVLALAEAGKLRPVVTRKEALSEASTVLADLRAGKVVGRAVLQPGPTVP